MKKILTIFGALMLSTLFCDSIAGQTWLMNEIAMKISRVSDSGEIIVNITNTSRKPVRIWNDWNSWGAGRWRIFVVRDGHLRTFFQNSAQNFTHNVPTFREIAPGGQIEEKLDPNDDEWCSLGYCRNSRGFSHNPAEDRKNTFRANDLIVVDYDVPAFPESLRFGVWWGVAATSTSIP